MAEITTHRCGVGLDEFVRIEPSDDLNERTGTHHKYQLSLKVHDVWGKVPGGSITFQTGPMEQIGPNGITMESLIGVVIDHLQGFQKGDCSCRENAIALTHLETALLWLHKRTRDRVARGVEGKMQK